MFRFPKLGLGSSPSECNCKVLDTLFSLPGLPMLHKDMVKTSLRLFWTAKASKSLQKPFATEPTLIKQHTRPEKRGQLQSAFEVYLCEHE